MEQIARIAAKIGMDESDIEPYGSGKAKVSSSAFSRVSGRKNGKLVLVTAISPTPYGEGKTTTSIGLSQSLWTMGKKVIVCLREPSLGPVFGVKGGATGGGAARVLPSVDINLHFTGDIHAVTAANNLLAAIVDNHLYQGNALGIDVNAITWRRCMDMNDRALRSITVGVGGKSGTASRADGFDISVASEIMAVLCLSSDVDDLKARLGRMVVAATKAGKPVTCADLRATGALAALLRDALKPNLVQTMVGSPAFIHGGPFANIAHGCNSIIATRLGLKYGDIVVTEAGFGADLGAEKFLDIKCRIAGLTPDAVVLVATVRALKHHGDGDLSAGIVNLGKHVENMQSYGLPVVVAMNRFPDDTDEEIAFVRKYCDKLGVAVALSEVFAKGAEGGMELARFVLDALSKKASFKPLYDPSIGPEKVIEAIATKIYGADGVDFSEGARKSLEKFKSWGYSSLPVCIAKTQYSLSDDPKKLGRPKGFRVVVREVRLSAGAGFFVAITGDIMTMPGLPKVPAAERVDVDKDGNIVGV